MHDAFNEAYRNLTKPQPKNWQKLSHYDTTLIYLKTMSKDELKSLKKEINKLLRQQSRNKIGKFVNNNEKAIVITCTIISVVVAIIALILQILL